MTKPHLISNLIFAVHHNWAVPKGWWTDLETGKDLSVDYPAGEIPSGSKSIGNQIALIHSEISEAYEGYRRNKMDDHCPQFTSLEVELTDALIRICDMAGGLNLRLAEAFEAKMEFNQSRPDHEPSARKAEGGKKT